MAIEENFDPYACCLGIADHEHPVDYYRLLGVTRFERDLSQIAIAADQRMAHIRTFQTGPRGHFTQPLLNELAKARLCLLDPAAKAAYDAMLDGTLRAPREPPRSRFEQPPELPPPADLAKPSEPRKRPLGGGVAISLVLLAAAGLAAAIVHQRSDHDNGGNSGGRSTFELTQQPRSGPAKPQRDAVLLHQEGDGRVNFTATVAQLHGPNIRLAVMNDVDVITDWNSMDDWLSWRFKIVRLPPQGIFHVHVTYAARKESDGGSFVLAVGDQQRDCVIRGTGQPVTDEYFLAVPNTGEHVLTVRPKSKPSERLMTLKAVTFAFP